MTRAQENAAIEARNRHRRRKDKRRRWCTVVPSKPCVKCYQCSEEKDRDQYLGIELEEE